MKRHLSRSIAFSVLLIAASAFAHAGHVHTYMGTVTMMQGDSFTIKTTSGKDITVLMSPKTTYRHSDNHAAQRSELAVGMRVVVKMSTDGKTATSVKMSAPKKNQ